MLNGGSWTLNGYTATTYGQIDNMVYSYNAQNQVLIVKDNSLLDRGFKSVNNPNATQYTYDANGNMKTDLNKGITNIEYNYLNLPQVITFTGNRSIIFVYDVSGAKLRKISNNNGTSTTQWYVNGVEYNGNILERLPHTEGEIVKDATGNYIYQYALKDHLGNRRVTFVGNTTTLGTVAASDIKQVNHYYPFGMNMEGPAYSFSGLNKYQYNEKELNTDFGLNWNDYGARFYDASIGRFTAIDPLAGKYMGVSPYCYVLNKPTSLIDPTGMAVTETEDRYTYTGQDAQKLFEDIQRETTKNLAPGIYVNNVGDILFDISKKGDKTPNVYLLRKEGKADLLGQIGGVIDASEIYRNLLEQNIAIAVGIYDPRTFRDFVNYGGIWDYKARYDQPGRRNTIYGYINLKLGNNTSFYFDGKILEVQDIGNHHFGVVGKACHCGIDENMMLRAAGQAQIKAGTSNPQWIKWQLIDHGENGVFSVMLPPYGDDPRDQEWIKGGFYYWDNRAKQKP